MSVENLQSDPSDSVGGNARPMTKGEKAVGLTFNPGGNDRVNEIKKHYAAIIDLLERYRPGQNGGENHPEVQRMLSVAITESQTAQMWAVKAVTWQY